MCKSITFKGRWLPWYQYTLTVTGKSNTHFFDRAILLVSKRLESQQSLF